MSNKKQRMQNANNYHALMRKVGPERQCVNCKKWHRDGGHFVPPSFREEGFFICKSAP